MMALELVTFGYTSQRQLKDQLVSAGISNWTTPWREDLTLIRISQLNGGQRWPHENKAGERIIKHIVAVAIDRPEGLGKNLFEF